VIKEPLKQILENNRSLWDTNAFRAVVRDNFDRVTRCRTLKSGGEVYASDSETKIVPHTCKSRSCPSCGHRATELWQREVSADLPDIPYLGLVFTMPDVLWPIQNRPLLYDLPRLGAAVIEQWVYAEYGVRVMILIVQHTFGRRLNFNPHLHILVSAGGLHERDGRWISSLTFDKNILMNMWRDTIITFLQQALRGGVLSAGDLGTILSAQRERWWSIHVAHFKTKWQFLRYAGRYVRRPPIAQHSFEKIADGVVQFWRKDLRKKERILTEYPIEQFVSLLADHVHDHYRHAIRYFGLLAPYTKRRTSAAVFTLLGRRKLPRPPRISWRYALRAQFGVYPLVDAKGQELRRVGRVPPVRTGG
jgi:Putative transposase/Transposase zinc-binding domain